MISELKIAAAIVVPHAESTLEMKMASVQVALFLFVCLHSSAGGWQTFPEAPSNGDPCQDCTQIFKLLADMLSNPGLQKKMMGGIEYLCDHLPGPPSVAKYCKDEVEKIYPIAIAFLTTIMKPEQVCTLLRLCGSDDELRQLLDSVSQALEAAVEQEKGQPATPCSFCIFLLQTLESLMPKEKTEGAVLNLLGHICSILPATLRGECKTLIGTYGKMLLDAIMKLATPRSICALVHLCSGQEVAEDPCILKTYMCRDFETAVKCGTVPFCQRFMWKAPPRETR